MVRSKSSRGLAWSHGRAKMELVNAVFKKVESKGYTCEYCKVTYRLKATLSNHKCPTFYKRMIYINHIRLEKRDKMKGGQ